MRQTRNHNHELPTGICIHKPNTWYSLDFAHPHWQILNWTFQTHVFIGWSLFLSLMLSEGRVLALDCDVAYLTQYSCFVFSVFIANHRLPLFWNVWATARISSTLMTISPCLEIWLMDRCAETWRVKKHDGSLNLIYWNWNLMRYRNLFLSGIAPNMRLIFEMHRISDYLRSS